MSRIYDVVVVSHGDEEVARIVNVSLEDAFRLTQNIQDSWSMQEAGGLDLDDRVTVLAPLHFVNGRYYGLRSTMTGDTFLVDGVEKYEVSFFGFEKIWTAEGESLVA